MGGRQPSMDRMGLTLPLLLAVVSLFSLYGPANGGCGWCERCQSKPYREGIFPLFDAVNSYRRANGLSNLKCDEVLTELLHTHPRPRSRASFEKFRMSSKWPQLAVTCWREEWKEYEALLLQEGRK